MTDLTNTPFHARIRVVGSRVEFVYHDLSGKPRSSLVCHVAGDVVEWRKPNINMAVSIGTVEPDGAGGYYLKIPLPTT